MTETLQAGLLTEIGADLPEQAEPCLSEEKCLPSNGPRQQGCPFRLFQNKRDLNLGEL